MGFEPHRAHAFGHYVLSLLLEKHASKKLLKIDRPQLAKLLGVQKLWGNHIEEVRAAAVEQGIAMADFGPFFLFFESAAFPSQTVKLQDALKITDKYADLYHSKAADEQFERDKRQL